MGFHELIEPLLERDGIARAGRRESPRPAPRRLESTVPRSRRCARPAASRASDRTWPGWTSSCTSGTVLRSLRRAGGDSRLRARRPGRVPGLRERPVRALTTTSTTSWTRSPARPSCRRGGAAGGRRSSAAARMVSRPGSRAPRPPFARSRRSAARPSPSGGFVHVAASIPSNPTMERSSGTRRPCAAASCIAPMAIRSLEQITAVGRPAAGFSRSSRSASRPPLTVNSECATRPSPARPPESVVDAAERLLACRQRVRVAGDEADPLVAQLDQVLRRDPAGGALVHADRRSRRGPRIRRSRRRAGRLVRGASCSASAFRGRR